MIYYILGAVLACIVCFVIIVAMRPPAFKVERSIAISAPAERIFDQVNDLHAWKAWSPFERLDPNIKKTFDGPAAGLGATYEWEGNSKAGKGRMTIDKSERPGLISIKLEFLKPFVATNNATFTFVPEAAGTKVTWSMTGRKNFVVKAFSMFMNMDKMIGADFDRGLASLKTIAEGGAV